MNAALALHGSTNPCLLYQSCTVTLRVHAPVGGTEDEQRRRVRNRFNFVGSSELRESARSRMRSVYCRRYVDMPLAVVVVVVVVLMVRLTLFNCVVVVVVVVLMTLLTLFNCVVVVAIVFVVILVVLLTVTFTVLYRLLVSLH